METKFYVLNEQGEPVRASREAWQEWYNRTDHHVAYTQIGSVQVSTIFLGVSAQDGESPTLWETMVLGGRKNLSRDRCNGSREAALAMHEKMVNAVKETITDKD